jgi:hypothetical protein
MVPTLDAIETPPAPHRPTGGSLGRPPARRDVISSALPLVALMIFAVIVLCIC